MLACGRGPAWGRYDIEMMERKTFGRLCFNGEIVSRYVDNNRWHAKYTNYDSEYLSDN